MMLLFDVYVTPDKSRLPQQKHKSQASKTQKPSQQMFRNTFQVIFLFKSYAQLVGISFHLVQYRVNRFPFSDFAIVPNRSKSGTRRFVMAISRESRTMTFNHQFWKSLELMFLLITSLVLFSKIELWELNFPSWS
jgi:hypothetical protein